MPICGLISYTRSRLAGSADATAMNQAYGFRANMSSYGMALLGLALEQVKDNRAGGNCCGAGKPRSTGSGAGVVAADSRSDARLFGGHDAGSTAYVAKFLLAEHGQRAAAQGGAVADESSQ